MCTYLLEYVRIKRYAQPRRKTKQCTESFLRTGSLKQTDRKNRMAGMNRTPISTVNMTGI